MSDCAFGEDASLIEVARKMAENQISGLPVVKDDQTVSGIISVKDFLKRMNDVKEPYFMRVISLQYNTILSIIKNQ